MTPPPATAAPTPPADPRGGLAAQAAFLARMGCGNQFRALFDHLPDVDFFAKDIHGHFIAASAGLIRRLGFTREEEVLGLTDADIHPARVAEEIRADDLRVMTTREPLVDRVEALFTRSQAKDWYVTTKLPILDAAGDVIGIMGFVRPYLRDAAETPGAERLHAVIAHIHAHHGQPLAIPDLARIAHLSVRQLHRQFQAVFGMSTQTFLARTRVQAASDDLLLTGKSLAEIAQEHGFCDQSAFSRRFAEHTGETPLKYRQRQRRNAAGR